MVIIKQCDNCIKKGKKVYCNHCIKSVNFFDVYKYNNSRFDNGYLIAKIKAYTWHDATEYIKHKYYSNSVNDNLIIDCEKDFAYLQEKNRSKSFTIINNSVEKKEDLLGYKIYLNNTESESSFFKNFKDQTIDLT